MRNRYIGDIGDFGKYALLKALCGEGQAGERFKLGVVWYLVGDRNIEYLRPSKKNNIKFRDCDEVLYDRLAGIVRGESRTVTAIERSGVLPGTPVFVNEAIKGGRQRREWLESALEQTKNCTLVFLDPDTGLRLAEASDSSRRKEYAYLDEVVEFAARERERNVVVYHHLARRNHQDQVDDWLRELKQTLPTRTPFALRFQAYYARAFLIIPTDVHRSVLVARARALVEGVWGRRALFEDKLFGP